MKFSTSCCRCPTRIPPVRNCAEHGFHGVDPPVEPGAGGGPFRDGATDGPVRCIPPRRPTVTSWAPVRVSVAPVGEHRVGVETGSFQQVRGVADLGHRNTARRGCARTSWGSGWWGVVGVAADVAVEVVVGQLVNGDDPGEPGDVGKVPIGGGIFSSSRGRRWFWARPSP